MNEALTVMGRKRRDASAVANVRRCRQLAKRASSARAKRRPDEFYRSTSAERQRRYRERIAHERLLAGRMVSRWWRDPLCPPPHVIVFQFEFWQAMACGWNPLDPRIARDHSGTSCDPGKSESWLWWTQELDRHARQQVVSGNRIMLMRPKIV